GRILVELELGLEGDWEILVPKEKEVVLVVVSSCLFLLTSLTLFGFIALTAPRANASALLKPTSGVTQALSAKSLTIESQLRGAFAKTTLTTVYSNPNEQQIEADFLYSAPKGSVVTGFAYWYGKEKVVARVVEKGRAAKIYQYITSRMRDPALIEMVGKNSFRARIFPIEAGNDLKIEIQLAQTLEQTAKGPQWTYPLREETQNKALEKVKIRVHSASPATSNLGQFEDGDLRIDERNYQAQDDLRTQVAQKAAPIRASLLAARDGGEDGFFALSLTPNSTITHPIVNIAGVPTYEVLTPEPDQLAAGEPIVVLGRYRGSGKALVSLGGQSLEVEFPNAVEKGNVASLLWAANRIETLSEDEKNEMQVMKMSKRFGVPSKWTSWLAIPAEERENFKRQMWASDRADAAQAYAQALARNDSVAVQEQKLIFDSLTQKLKKLGHEYSENEELQPLSSYLNDELRRVRKAMFEANHNGGVDETQLAEWKTWTSNLQKAGATDKGKGVDLPVYVIEDELRIASRGYMREVELGQANSAKAQGFQARLKELAQTRTAKEYEWDEKTFLSEAADMRGNALAMDIATNRASQKRDLVREKQNLARLHRLETASSLKASDTLQQALQTVWGEKIENASQPWAREIIAGRSRSATARKYEKQVRDLQQRSGLKQLETIDSAWKSLAGSNGERAAKAIQQQGIDGQSAKRLDAQIRAIARLSGQSNEELRSLAWNSVGNSIAQDLAKEVRAERWQSPTTKRLQAQFEVLRNKHNIDSVYEVDDAWSELESETATRLAHEISSKRENGPRAKQLSARLNELAKYTEGQNDWSVREAWGERAREATTQHLEVALRDGEDSPRAVNLAEKRDLLFQKAHLDAKEFKDSINEDMLRSLDSQISDGVVFKRENSADAMKATLKRTRLLALYPALKNYEPIGPLSETLAWEGRAHESAYLLLQANKKGEKGKANHLRADLDLSAQKAGKSRDAVLKWEKAKLNSGQPLIKATDYRLHPGDPLISVLAPADCRQVLALMPDGTILPLRFDALKNAWEARFDVPAGAEEGDYRVQIVIVAPDGTRKRLVMNFAVDMLAPTGAASLRAANGQWNLRLETDEQTDRV
ncbi:hypothetical protein EON80_12740, partial [bacterium]